MLGLDLGPRAMVNNGSIAGNPHFCDLVARIKDVGSINSLKGRLDKIRKTRMGFYAFCMVCKALGLMEMGPPCGRPKKCDQCNQCDRPLPGAPGMASTGERSNQERH